MKKFFKSMLSILALALTSHAWATGENISIKFNGGDLAEDTDYGCYPVAGSAWFKTTGGSASGTLDLNETSALATSLTWSAPVTYNASGLTTTADALFSTFLDDNLVKGTKTEISVTGLDTTVFANYDVLIYLSGDSTSPFRALTVNGTSYTAALGEGFAAKPGTHYWGQCSATSLATPTIGVNTLYIKGLTATADANTLSISVNAVNSNDRANGRACIAALQIIPANAISDSETVTIPSFSNPSWRPEGEMPQVAWGDSPFATTAYGANTDAASTTSDGFTAQAVWLRGAQNTPIVFAGNDETTGGLLDKNLMLLVTGGDYNMIFGGSNSVRWQGSSKHNISGNIFVEMKGGTAKGVFGGNYKDGFSPELTGDIDVLIDGDAQVSGVVAGGGVSAHNQTTTYGSANEPVNLNVTVKNVQTTTGSDNVDGLGGLVPNFIIGGPVWGTNTGGDHTVYGNTTAKVVLPSTASGEFVKAIVGAAVNRSGYGATGIEINGTSSVVIDAPNAVTFSKPIYGGALTTSAGTATVQNSSVTINGGTFTNTIYAGGDGNNSAVSGTATLTLNGGNFSTATVTPGKAANSELLINGDVDLSSTTVEAFDQMVIAQGKCLTLGTNRLLMTSLQGGGTAGWATLKITLTDNELSAESAIICAYDGNVFPTIEYTNKPEDQTWTLFVGDGKLCVGVRGEYTWTSGSTSWDEGLSEFTPGGDIVFGRNETEETVTIPRDIVAGDVKIQGAYKFQGAKLDALSVTLENGASLSLSNESVTLQYCRYIRLTPSNVNGGTGDNAYPGFAELILTQNGTAVAWPIGTTIVQKNNDSSEVLPEWNAGGNEKVNALIDGVYGGQSANGTGVNPATKAQVSYNAPIQYNKWWPRGQQNASAVITLGSLITFDGYQLVSTDHSPRSPKNWTLEASLDGRTWVTVDTQTNRTIPNANSFYKYEAENSTFPVSSLAVPSQATVNTLAINIAANATLTIGNANAIGTTGNITGAGTLVCNGVLPTTAEQRITNANWRGKVVLQAIPSFTNLDLDEFGNADSVIELNGIGNGTNQTYMRHTQTIASDVILTGDNWFTDGSYTTTVTFNGDISGDGAFKFKKYNGSSNPAETWIFNGAYNASIVNEDATDRKIIFGSGTAEGGKIVIAKDVTIAAQKTWESVNGIAIMKGATLTVNGAITGAITNAGVLTYGVDTTASNTISGAGEIQVAVAKTVDLSAATLTSFTGTYSVGEGATLKLPLTATDDKEITLGTDAKLLVVLNDEQKGAEQSVTVTGGAVQFVDANGNVLCDGASYTMPTYTVGEGWTGANLIAGASVVIDFAGTMGETVDLASILGDVTALTKLTVVGTKGGTLTKSGEAATITITTTVINTNTIVDAGVAALGAVTIADEMILTVKDTATVSTLSGTGVYNLDLGETTVNSYTFAADGKNYKVSSGTFTNVTLERSATKTTYEFAGGTITMATAQAGADHGNVDVGQFSFGTADVTISGGKINATHLVTVQEGNNRSTTINQTGGDIILSGTGDGSDTLMNRQTIMFGHWRNAESTYTLSGGSLVAENGGMRISNDSPATVSISGGLLKVKGIKGKGEQTTSLTLSGGKLSIGDWGMAAIGNLTFTAQGGEINAFGNATINQAIALNGNVTLSADAGKTLTIKAPVTGTGTETLTLSGKIIFAVRPTNIGKIVFEEGAVLCFTENIRDDGEITLPTIEGTPTIKIIRADGETEVNASIVDGKATFTPLYSGKICWHDYEFNKSLNDAGYGNKTLSRDSGRPSWSTGNQNTTNESEIATDYKDLGNGNYALFAATHPYTNFTYPQEWTAVIVATLPEEEDEILLAFGTLDGGTISLIKGKNADEVKLVRTTGNSKYEALATMTVPNATTAAHLYAFTKTARQIKIYLDGSLWLTYVAQSDITFGAGFQIASVHGGIGNTGMKRPVEADEGVSYIDALRMYEAVLSQKAITALANEFPYNSPKGTYMRTVNGEVNWSAEGMWRKVGDNVNTYAMPAPGSTVILTAETDATVVVNFDGNVSYEAITVNGHANVSFDKGIDSTGVIQNSGKTQIDTNVTIAAGVMEVHGGPLTVSANNSLTFDYSQHDFSTYYVDSEILLTGIATVSDDTAVAISLGSATLPSHIKSVICKPNATKNYVLSITVTGELSATIENNAITWKVGETVVTPPADLTAVGSITMTVVGNNSVALTEDMTLASVVLTGEGGSVTFENGKLTVTNTLTMNNVNVMATPDTLAAAVVMGTAGTESFTMYSRASYSHENKFAMRFENCAFTKDGEGTFPIASSGFVLDNVNVTLKNGALQLVIGSGDPQIKDTTFTYVDANADGVADGELTNHGWVHSTTTTTFVVPGGVTGKAVVGSCLSNTGAVVKQGAGTLELGVMKTTNAGPYTGATTIEAGTLVYDVTNNTANPFVMNSEITVKAGAAIKGVEDCTLASLILENGAIIDATDAPVVATVTLPTQGNPVILKKGAPGDVLSYTGEKPNMSLFSPSATFDNAVLSATIDNGTVTLVLTQVAVPKIDIPENATDEERAEAEKAQAEAVVAAQVVADALAASLDEETRTANVTEIENPGAASIIENADVELTQNEGEETYTAKFTYDFGVSAIKVVALNLDDVEGAELYVVVKAELDDDYSFAEGVTVSVTDGNNAVEGAVSVNEAGTESDVPTTGNTRYFRFPLPTDLGTHSYKVRATK